MSAVERYCQPYSDPREVDETETETKTKTETKTEIANAVYRIVDTDSTVVREIRFYDDNKIGIVCIKPFVDGFSSFFLKKPQIVIANTTESQICALVGPNKKNFPERIWATFINQRVNEKGNFQCGVKISIFNLCYVYQI